MPFIRHLRDRRGYETTVVMHGYRPAQGPARSRVLYLFLSPSHIKVGREALDEEAREALEHTHPDLRFDWIALGRERDAMRAHQMRERDRDRDRNERPGPSRGAGGGQGERPRQPVKVVIEDHSTLGHALGAERAATLRTQYAELVQRIHRRARTPEEREQLLERAHRLNPDDWMDAGSIPAQAARFDADRQAIVGELPGRRRGRRGGRRGERQAEDNGQTAAQPGAGDAGAGMDDSDADEPGPDTLFDESADASAIMADASEEGEDSINARAEHSGGTPADTPGDRGAIGRGDGPGFHSESAAGDGLPGDDELRRH